MHYMTNVREVGPEASSFLANGMAVLFGNEAPAELREFCFIIDRVPFEGELRPGMTLDVDGVESVVTAIGDIAQKNLEELGHVTLNFDGADRAELAGSIHLQAADHGPPSIKLGSRILIRSS